MSKKQGVERLRWTLVRAVYPCSAECHIRQTVADLESFHVNGVVPDYSRIGTLRPLMGVGLTSKESESSVHHDTSLEPLIRLQLGSMRCLPDMEMRSWFTNARSKILGRFSSCLPYAPGTRD